MITSEGRLFTFGKNSSGQLGDSTTVDKSMAIPITLNKFAIEKIDFTDFIETGLGYYHSVSITGDGKVYTWGLNDEGQLGDGTTTSTHQFDIGDEDKIVMVESGARHSIVLSSEGRVFAWGLNSNGQIGDSTLTTRLDPVEITGRFDLYPGEYIVTISSGSFHSGAITSQGRVFMWGANSSGQLGDSSTQFKPVPYNITNRFSLYYQETIVQLDLGFRGTAAITSQGRIFTWGANTFGELGDY